MLLFDSTASERRTTGRCKEAYGFNLLKTNTSYASKSCIGLELPTFPPSRMTNTEFLTRLCTNKLQNLGENIWFLS